MALYVDDGYVNSGWVNTGIYIDWASRVIFVPKESTDLIQLAPTEIRELNLDIFRKTLKNLEDDEDGIFFPNTHNHNTAVLLGGLEYARIIEIINGYTVTFEDGMYAVNLVGANSNVGDVVNVNNVSVRSANSAGLIQTREIQYNVFDGAVHIDQTNGVSGTAYPAGTPLQPVNNVADARFIAALRGFTTLHVIGDLALDTGDDVSYLKLVGNNAVRTSVTIATGANTVGVEIVDASVTGTLDGGTLLRDCYVHDLSYVNGFVYKCELAGTITLGGVTPASILDCFSDVAGVTINFSGSGQQAAIHNFSGDLRIRNRSGTAPVEVYLNSGVVDIDSTVTSGVNFEVGGVGILENDSPIVPDKLNLLSKEGIWDLPAGIEADVTPREALRIILAAVAGKLSGAPTGPISIRNVGDTKTRISADVDNAGNRTNVTVDGS